MWSRLSRTLPRRNRTKSLFVSRATRIASDRIRRRISVVKVPTPGPYSRNTRARAQSTSWRRGLTRKRELGIRLPSILGCFKKLRPKSRSCSEREARGRDTMGTICLSGGRTGPAPGSRRRWAGYRSSAPGKDSLPRLGRIPARVLDITFLDRRVRANRGVAGDDRGVLRRARGDARVRALADPRRVGAALVACGDTGNQRQCCEYGPHLTSEIDVKVVLALAQ